MSNSAALVMKVACVYTPPGYHLAFPVEAKFRTQAGCERSSVPLRARGPLSVLVVCHLAVWTTGLTACGFHVAWAGYYNYKMDMWGVGCVFFELVSLFPLFPGNDEVEQIRMIHSVLGTPPDDLLEKIKKRSQHFPPEFKFDYEPGTGIAELLVKAQASPECVDLINRLLAYNPDDRLCAHQVRFPIFNASVWCGMKRACVPQAGPCRAESCGTDGAR